MSNEIQETIWQQAIEKAGLAEFSDVLRPEARPCFRLGRLVPDLYAEVGNSRIGGRPDMPPDLAWPLDDRMPMTFLAQIDLAALEPGLLPELPSRGWLYFFLGRDEQQRAMPHRVLYHDGPRSELRYSFPPEDLPPLEAFLERKFPPVKVRFVAGYSLEFDSPAWAKAGIDIQETEPPYNLYTESTQIRGHQLEFNFYPDHAAYVHMNGLDGYPALAHFLSTPESPDEDYLVWHREHGAGVARWRPLFILESLPSISMHWLDLGLLHFMIHEDDLAAGRFDRTFCDLMST